MLFSWYAADYCTDPQRENLSPEGKANPSALELGRSGLSDPAADAVCRPINTAACI